MTGNSSEGQRPPTDRLWGADRLILYLEGPVTTLTELDGAREQDIRNKTRKFLDSPAAAFDKHPTNYIGHIRALNSNTRAFATWCQNTELTRELCVVHEIYRKKNESAYWPDLDDYNKAGEEFASSFRGLTVEKYDSWIEQLHTACDIEVLTSN
jgi:hypothetical protein